MRIASSDAGRTFLRDQVDGRKRKTERQPIPGRCFGWPHRGGIPGLGC